MSPFRLESVLKYRKMKKDAVQQTLGKLLKKEADLMAEIADEQKELNRLHYDLDLQQIKGITPHELQLYENRCDLKKDCLQTMEEKLQAVRDEIIICRQALLEASKNEKILDKLKEKHLAEEQREIKKKETIESDEIAIRFHGR